MTKDQIDELAEEIVKIVVEDTRTRDVLYRDVKSVISRYAEERNETTEQERTKDQIHKLAEEIVHDMELWYDDPEVCKTPIQIVESVISRHVEERNETTEQERTDDRRDVIEKLAAEIAQESTDWPSGIPAVRIEDMISPYVEGLDLERTDDRWPSREKTLEMQRDEALRQGGEAVARLRQRIDKLEEVVGLADELISTFHRDVIESLVMQFAGQGVDSNGLPAYSTMGLSVLEDAFEFLGWSDPQPAHDKRCQVGDCKQWATCGTPTPDGGYKRCCGIHFNEIHKRVVEMAKG